MAAATDGGRSEETTKGPVLLFPFMAHGHLIPFLHFARLLHSRSPDLPLLLVSTPSNAHLLRSSPLLPPTLRFAELLLPTTTSPLAAENTDSLSRPQINAFYNTSESLLFQPFTSLFDQLHPPPSCIVSDMFLAWTVDVAHARGVGHAVLYSSGPYSMSIYNSICKHLPHLDHDDDEEDEEVHLPDLPDVSIKMSQISDVMKKFTAESPSVLFYRRQAELCSRSDACLFNTAAAIEGPSLDRWREATGQPVYAVGPLSMFSPPALVSTGKTPGVPAEACVQWLDRHPRRSVLYVCFGSQNSLSIAQMFELAAGLEESGRPFIWVVRAPTGHYPGETTIDPRWLPAGFERRVEDAGRGLLVAKWAAQGEILAHESTGAFLSHCGWNSVVEAVAGGVAVLAWPLASEQFYNAQLVEEAMGVGWEVGRGAGMVVKAGVVATAVREALGGERGEAARRAAELRARLGTESAVAAVDEFMRTVVIRRRGRVKLAQSRLACQ